MNDLMFQIRATSGNPSHRGTFRISTDGERRARQIYSALQVSADVKEVRLYQNGVLIDATDQVDSFKWRASK